MGTWGPGNFQSDGALDYLSHVLGQLVDRVEGLIAAEGGAGDVDELGETHLVPTVEMISVLCESCPGAPPQPEVVLRWRDAYLARWERQIGALRPTPGYREARRAVIAATFGRLHAHADAFWSRAVQ